VREVAAHADHHIAIALVEGLEHERSLRVGRLRTPG